jgi:primosomal replication protein N
MTANRMALTGTVARTPIRSASPSGIEHCRFWLEHRSVQQEAGLTRDVYCKMPVVFSSQNASSITQNLVQGSDIKVIGFVVYQKDKNGLGKLVLHAEQIIHI